MTDIFPSEKQIEEAVKNSNEIKLIKNLKLIKLARKTLTFKLTFITFFRSIFL